MGGRAHGFEAPTDDPLGAAYDSGISLCAHADDLATTGNPLSACADATCNRQRVREGQDIQGLDRAGFLVEPVGQHTIGPGDHHGAVAVEVVAVLVDVNVGVLVLGRPVHIRLAEDRLCRALRHIVVEAGLVHVFEEAADERDAAQCPATRGLGIDLVPRELLVEVVGDDVDRIVTRNLHVVDECGDDITQRGLRAGDVEVPDSGAEVANRGVRPGNLPLVNVGADVTEGRATRLTRDRHVLDEVSGAPDQLRERGVRQDLATGEAGDTRLDGAHRVLDDGVHHVQRGPEDAVVGLGDTGHDVLGNVNCHRVHGELGEPPSTARVRFESDQSDANFLSRLPHGGRGVQVRNPHVPLRRVR